MQVSLGPFLITLLSLRFQSMIPPQSLLQAHLGPKAEPSVCPACIQATPRLSLGLGQIPNDGDDAGLEERISV